MDLFSKIADKAKEVKNDIKDKVVDVKDGIVDVGSAIGNKITGEDETPKPQTKPANTSGKPSLSE